MVLSEAMLPGVWNRPAYPVVPLYRGIILPRKKLPGVWLTRISPSKEKAARGYVRSAGILSNPKRRQNGAVSGPPGGNPASPSVEQR